MRFALLATLVLLLPSLADAQARPHPVGATPPWLGDSPDTLPPAPPPPPRALRGDGCSAGETVATIGAAPVVGGSLGWLMGGIGFYTFGFGALASDTRNAQFRDARRTWLRAGTALGVATGVVVGTRHLLQGCPAPPERARVRRVRTR